MADTRPFCVSCGIEVDTFAVLQAGKNVLICANCGADIPPEQQETPAEAPPAEPPIDVAIVAEDTKLLRTLITDIMRDKGLAKEIVGTANGRDFLQTYAEQRRRGRNVGLAVLDVNMPIMNGINAAVAMRGVEQGFPSAKATPILFFTVRVCDENFKKVLKFTSPSMYINKGSNKSPMALEERVQHIVTKLLTERSAGKTGETPGQATAEYIAGNPALSG